MKYTEQFNNIDNEIKAYVLGLFYSDGYVTSSNNNCGITLHQDDTYLLEEILKYFPFFKLKRNYKKMSLLTCISKQLKIDLIKNGVLPIKSTTNCNLLKFPNIPKDLHNHFIRGFFDGDGSVYKQKLFNIKLEIGCTAYYLITDIIKILYDNNINVNLRCSFPGKNLRKINYYILYTSSYRESSKFANFIYTNCNIKMDRKHKLLNVIPEYKTKDRKECPKCKSLNTVFSGERNNKIRIYCKNCKKRSSLAAPISSNINSGVDELLES